MCDSKNECKGHNCDSRFSSKDDLIKYKTWLEHELSIVNKTLLDLED